MKQWFLILFLFIFNSLLLYTCRQRQNYQEQLKTQVEAEPSLDRYFNLQQHVAFTFGRQLSKLQPYTTYADCSNRLGNILKRWEEAYEGQPASIELLEKRTVPIQFQDSLWTGLENYRKAIDGVLSIALVKRKAKRDQYDQLKAVLGQKPSSKQLPAWMKKLDSLTDRIGYPVNSRDVRRLNDLVSSLDYQSDPVQEFHMNTLLNKFDNLVIARGKFILYDRDFVLNDITVLEERNLRHRLIMLKYAIDRQLLTLTEL